MDQIIIKEYINCYLFVAVVRRRIKGMVFAGKQYSLDSRMDIVSTMSPQRLDSEEEDKGRLNSIS